MIKHSVRPFVVAVLLCFSLSYSLTSSADEANTLPVTIVTTADYQIGAEGLPDSRQRSKSRAVTASGAQTKRQLVSLYGGESGDSIPERGYLTDVVWGEKTTYPAASTDTQAVTQERILYYSFNIGQWKRKLNSETSVLTRAFMTQPLLVFLSDNDKARIAAQLVKTPLFKQAVFVHKEQVGKSLANVVYLNDLIMALGENGVKQITEAQRKTSRQAFRSEIARQAKSISPAMTISPTLTFTDESPAFKAFEGMAISGNKNSQLDFNSYSSLYYGIQPLAEFDNTKGGFWTNVDRHFSAVSLLEPVSGWLDKDAIKEFVKKFGQDASFTKETTLELTAISPDLKTDNKPVNVAIFRNNPYVWFDAPQSMNIMTGLAVITKVVGETAAVFKPKLATDLMESLKKQLKKSDSFRAWFALTYSVINTGQQLICTLQEQREGICGDALQKLQQLAKMIPDAIKSTDDILKAEAAKDNDFTNKTSTFCNAELAIDLAASLFAPIDAVNDDSKKFRFTLCMINKTITAPLLAIVEKVLPDDYQEVTKKYNSVHLTADFLARKYDVAFVEPVEPRFRIESLTAKLLVKKAIDVKGILSSSVVAMQSVTDTTKFLQDVRDNKVEMQPLLAHLGSALQAYLVKSGKAMLANLTYDLLMSMTPGKYVHLAYTVGNDGSKLLWDWMTDPSVVKLSMTRTKKTDPDTQVVTDTLNISNTVPNMKGIRYLKLPTADTSILDYSEGIEKSGTLKSDDLYGVSNAPDTNHLLVYTDFRASVENQSAYPIEDQYAVNNLLATDSIRLRWHVKKFNKSAEITPLPYTRRTAANAYKGSKNNIDEPVKKGWTWWTDPIISLDGSTNLLHQPDVLGAAQKKFNAIDFTEVYRHQLGDKQPYPLTHKTPGIYSDYTHIQVTLGTDETLYQNTFNIYVLPNLGPVVEPGGQVVNLDDLLNQASRRYCEDEDVDCTQPSEVQLNFSGSFWDKIGQNGLWAVWMSADGVKLTEPVTVRHYSGNTSEALRPPEGVSLNDYLLIYEDTLHGYMQHSGKAPGAVLQKCLTARLHGGRYPLIALRLGGLQKTADSLLKPADTDKDGVPDDVDAFPNDFNYAYDTDHDTMPDEWEDFYGLDVGVDDRALDRDNDGIGNLDEFNAKTDPGHLSVTLTTGDKQVTLSWQLPLNTQTQSICWSAKPLVQPLSSCVSSDNSPSTWLANQTSPTVIKKLGNGKVYYFAVIVQDTTGKSIESKLLTATPDKPTTLNDTGISAAQCYQLDSNALVACTGEAAQALNKKQDGMMGRDLTQNNSSDGHLGFSFTKISATGAALPVTAGSWACVKDNVTGLLWENKTADGGLHDGSHRYTNYSADYGSGNLGAASDASGFVAAVNQQGLCGASNWRLPSADELQSIVDYGIAYPGPTIDSAFFPNTQNYAFWSSSPYVGDTNYAWGVNFGNGYVGYGSRGGSFAVRLVRASQ